MGKAGGTQVMTLPDENLDPLERIATSLAHIEAVLVQVGEAYLADRRTHQIANEAIADAERKAHKSLLPFYEAEEQRLQQRMSELNLENG